MSHIKSFTTIIFLLASLSIGFSIWPSRLLQLYSHVVAVPADLQFYSPLTRFWQFGAGGLLWLATSHNKTKFKSNPTADHAVLLIGFMILFFPIKWSGLPGQLIAAMLGVLLIGTSAIAKLPRQIFDSLRWVGDRSYSAYLVHLPVLYLLQQSPGLVSLVAPLKFVLWLIAIALILLLSNQLNSRVEVKYRLAHGEGAPVKNRLRKTAFYFHLIPIITGLALLAASSNNYFGLVEKTNINQEGQTFSKYCSRESFIRQFPCTFSGDPHGKKLLLVGDSHAAQYSLDIWEVANRLGYRVTFDGDFGGPIDPSKVIRYASAMKPDVIIVSKYWKSENGQLSGNISSTIVKLSRFAKKLIIFGQNPIYIPTISPTPEQSLFTKLFHAHEGSSDSLSRLTKLDPQAKLDGSLIAKLAGESGWGFLDVSMLFCPMNACTTGDSGGTFYFDSNHLSAHGAFKIRKPLEEMLLERARG